MIERSFARTRLAEGQVRYAVTVTGDPCVAGTVESAIRQADMMRMLADQPATTYCGPARWQRLAVCHDGTRWMVEASAIVEEPEEATE